MKFPYIAQMDEKDCGVACIAMILKYYGSEISLQKLREISGTTLNGTSAYGLKRAFQHYNLNFNAYKSNSDVWSDDELKLPLIAHVIINESISHYVVIYKVKGNIVYVADPGNGKYKKNITEFSNIWTGIILEASPNSKYILIHDKQPSLFSFIPMILEQKKQISIIILLSILITILGVVSSYYFQLLIDYLIPKENINILDIISTGILSIYIMETIAETIRTFLLNRLGQKMSQTLIMKYLKHVLHLPLNFFATRKSGEIMSRFLDANKIIEALATTILTLFLDVATVATIGTFLFIQNHQLFIITLLTLPLYIVTVLSFYKLFDKANKDEMAAEAELNSSIVESLKGIETIKAFSQETIVLKKINKEFSQLIRKSFHTLNTENIQHLFKKLIQVSSTVVILWVGSLFVINKNLTVGQLITYNALLVFFSTSLNNIINLQGKIQTAKVANYRLNEIFEIQEENKDVEKTNKLNSTTNQICLENVDFSYNFSEKILKSISMNIQHGEKIAILGDSGSGKSTLAKLLVKFYNVSSGQITLNSHPIKNLSQKSVRSKVTYVPQNSFFFSGTFLDNLTFGLNYIPSHEKIMKVCEFVELKEYVKNQPLGLNSIIEEGGNNLSGGQRQKLALGRGLLQNSSVLILDEITSGMDILLEKRIINHLVSMKNMTIIFVAHHLSIAKACEKIFVIQQGKIVESGSHLQLKHNGGIYEQLYEA